MRLERIFLAAALLACTAGVAAADVVTLAPVQAVLAPDDQSGVTKVLFRFDLSGLPEDEGLVVSTAVLDWVIGGMPSDRHSEYAVHVVTQSWTEAGVSGGTVPAASEDPFEVWDYEDLDYERNQGGRVRFFLGGLVRDWTGGETDNLGILVAGEDLDAEAIGGDLETVRLTVSFRVD